MPVSSEVARPTDRNPVRWAGHSRSAPDEQPRTVLSPAASSEAALDLTGTHDGGRSPSWVRQPQPDGGRRVAGVHVDPAALDDEPALVAGDTPGRVADLMTSFSTDILLNMMTRSPADPRLHRRRHLDLMRAVSAACPRG